MGNSILFEMRQVIQEEVVLEEPGRFAVRSGTLPDTPEGFARVRIRRIGVCGTDIHAFRGNQPFFEYPRILGHELGAEIVSVNGPGDWSPGELVAVEPYLNNPESPASRVGRTNCCENLAVLGVHCDGGMRPYLDVPVNKLHRAGAATVDQLALVEMLCIGEHAAARSRIGADDTALILGAGPIGMSVLQFVRSRTEKVIVADLDEARLDFCREALGAMDTITIREGSNLEEELRNRLGGDLPRFIFDATGNARSMAGTFSLVAHGGTIVLVGLFQGELAFNDPNFHRREITLMSSRNATAPDFARVIEAMASGSVDTSAWITHRLDLGDVPARFAEVIGSPGLRKAVISVED